MPYRRLPYGRQPYQRVPYGRSPYGLSPSEEGLVFNAPLITSLEEVFGATPAFVRSTNATYIGSDGLVKTAASNEPRFEYDPGGGARGLLVEPQRTNILVRSEEFNVTPWSPTRATVSPNSTVAPDGNTTADTLVEDSTPNNSHNLAGGSITVTAGATVVLAIYAKQANRNWIKIRFADAATGTDGYEGSFDIGAGTIGTTRALGVGTLASSDILALPNGWFRFNLIGTMGGVQTTGQVVINILDADDSPTFDGLNQDSFFLWGGQVEASDFMTSYIATQAASVTRVVDELTYPFSRSGDGSLLVTADVLDLGANRVFVQLDDGTDTNYLRLFKRDGGSNESTFEIGAALATIVGSPMAVKTPRRLTGTFTTGDANLYEDGAIAAKGTPASIPATTVVRIGNNAAGNLAQAGHVREVKIYNRVLSAGEA